MIEEIKDIGIINECLNNFNTSTKEIGVYSHYKVYKLNNIIVGFICYDLIYDRAEIEYIYVDKEYRGKGIASKLLEDLFQIAKDNKFVNITLEVRMSNVTAIELYKFKGFVETQIRKNYYKGEDGILMLKEM